MGLITTQMGTSTKGIGIRTCKMEQGLTTTPMVTSIKESGSTVDPMGKATISILPKGEFTKATGRRAGKRDSAS